MLFPNRDSDLFRELFTFVNDGGAAAGGDTGGATGGGAAAPAGGEAAAAPSTPEAKAEPTLAEKLKDAFASDTKPVEPKAEAPKDEEGAKAGEGEKPADTEKPLSATEKAIKAGVAAQLETERAALEAKIREDIRQEGKTTRQLEDDEVVSKGYEATLKNLSADITAGIKAITIHSFDESGKPVALELSDAAIAREVLPKLAPRLEAWKDVTRQVEEAQVLDNVAEAVLGVMPNDEVRERFTEKAGGKEWAEYMSEFAETMAPFTKWAQQTKKDQDAALTAKAAETEELLKNAPQGQASQRGGNVAAASTSEGKTVAENAAAIREGRLDVRAELARLTGRR